MTAPLFKLFKILLTDAVKQLKVFIVCYVYRSAHSTNESEGLTTTTCAQQTQFLNFSDLRKICFLTAARLSHSQLWVTVEGAVSLVHTMLTIMYYNYYDL